MNTDTFITIHGQEYPLQFTDKFEGKIGGTIYRYLSYDDKGDVQACINFTFSIDAVAAWNSLGHYKEDELLPIASQLLSHVEIPITEDELNKFLPNCLSVVVTVVRSENGSVVFDKDSKTLSIDCFNSPHELIRKVAYGGKITRDKVEAEVIRNVGIATIENGHNHESLAKLSQSLLIPDKILHSSIKSLLIKEVLMPIGSPIDQLGLQAFYKLSPKGLQIYEKGELSDSKTSHVYIGTNYGNAISSVGDNNRITQKMHIDSINNNLSELEVEVNKHYKGQDKQELGLLVNEVKTLIHDPNNKPKITSLLGKILSRTSEVSQIAQLVVTILSQLN